MSGQAALRVRGLSVTFATQHGDLPAVVDVDLDVERGELVALLGESGSGKSVTARAVMGLNPGNARVTARELRVGDHDLLALAEEERRRLRGSSVSLVLQDALSALNPVLSVGDQVAELFRVHRGLSRRDARRQVVDLLALVGIPAPERRARDYPHQFSGGQRQRIGIARALAPLPAGTGALRARPARAANAPRRGRPNSRLPLRGAGTPTPRRHRLTPRPRPRRGGPACATSQLAEAIPLMRCCPRAIASRTMSAYESSGSCSARSAASW